MSPVIKWLFCLVFLYSIATKAKEITKDPAIARAEAKTPVVAEATAPAPASASASAKTKANTPLSSKRQISSTSQKGYVVNIPPGQALPIPREEKSEKNQLIHFKMTKAPWLSQYPSIQKEVTKIIQDQKQEILKTAKDLFQEFPKSSLLPYRLYVEELKLFIPKRHDFSATCKSKHLGPLNSKSEERFKCHWYNKDIVSVRMRLYTYTGGAHGGSQYYSWNYNTKSQQFLSLRDMFPISDYCAKLTMVGRKPFFQKQPLPECLKPSINQGEEIKGSEEFLNTIIQTQDILFAFRKQGNEYDRYIKGDILRGTIKAKHFKIWNVHEDKIVFLFPEYQVGPYSAGSFEVFVPLW